jgi:hypothetical protein
LFGRLVLGVVNVLLRRHLLTKNGSLLLGFGLCVAVPLAIYIRPGLLSLAFPSQVSRNGQGIHADSTTKVGQATLLVPSSAELDFGVLPQGGHHDVTFWLQNPGQSPVEVFKVKTSCDCFEVALEKNVIQAGEKVSARASVDFSKDPEFAGRLRLEATGEAQLMGPSGFIVCVYVKVANRP